MAEKRTISLSTDIRRELNKACTAWREFHWGREPEEALLIRDVKPIPPVVYILGHLTGETYVTVKGKNGEKILYVHAHNEPLPLLVSNPEGTQLYIVGGKYKVQPRGIVD